MTDDDDDDDDDDDEDDDDDDDVEYLKALSEGKMTKYSSTTGYVGGKNPHSEPKHTTILN